MSKVVQREVIDGHMTVTQVRRIPGKEYTAVEPGGAFDSKVREVTKRHKGYLCVESLVYAGRKAEGEPVAEWELPIELRYDLHKAAAIAVRQTDFGS